jgi:hypothetical protein
MENVQDLITETGRSVDCQGGPRIALIGQQQTVEDRAMPIRVFSLLGFVIVGAITSPAQTKGINLMVAHPLPAVNSFLQQPQAISPVASAGSGTLPDALVTRSYTPVSGIENRLPVEFYRTPFVTVSSVPVAQAMRGHLQIEGFGSTQYSVQFGPAGIDQPFRPPSHDQEGVNRSDDLNGIRVRLTFGNSAVRNLPIWRSVKKLL